MTIRGIFLALSMGIASSASAMSVDFDLLNPAGAAGQSGQYADAYTYEESGIDLRISGLSSGGDRYRPGGNYRQSHVGINDYGLGVERRGGYRGTIDNIGYDFDFLMLEFDRDVSLSSIGVSFVPRYADSDISVGAIDGYSIFTANIYDAVVGDNPVDAGASSSTWLIGAFNPLFGYTQDYIWDAFRIDSITVNVSQVPLPAAFWFLASGLLALGYYRRKSAV